MSWRRFNLALFASVVLAVSPLSAIAQDPAEDGASEAAQNASEKAANAASEASAAAAQAAAEKAAEKAQAAAELAAEKAQASAELAAEKAQASAEAAAAKSSQTASEGASNSASESAAEQAGSTAASGGETDTAESEAEDSASATAASQSVGELDDNQAQAAAGGDDDRSVATGVLSRLAWWDRADRLDVIHEPDGGEIVRDEFVALVDEHQPTAPASGYRLVERVRLPGLGMMLLRYRSERSDLAAPAPAGGQSENDGAIVEPNHVFRLADDIAGVARRTGAKPTTPVSTGARKGLVGMVDSPVDTHYPSLIQAVQEARSFAASGAIPSSDHGTAVADILARQNVRVLAANAFALDANGAGAASTAALITSLDWLVAHGAKVINLSLSGPRDVALGEAIRRAQARGCVIVAAAGNNGPAAPPSYPAAFPDVVAVTAIDRQDHIYRNANRGPYIAFSALGVDVDAAAPPNRTRKSSGTSFASPLVAAVIARLAGDAGAQNAPLALADVQSHARHLGEPGRNPVYGYGAIDPLASETSSRLAKGEKPERPGGF